VSREENDQMTHVDEPRVTSADPATASAVLPDATDCGGVSGTPECWPLPWHCERNAENGVDYIVPADAELSTAGVWWPSMPIFDDGLETFIAHRVNCYPDLLAACKKVVEHYGDPAQGDLFGLRAAIAKAERGQ
jgi:hypothetical protein